LDFGRWTLDSFRWPEQLRGYSLPARPGLLALSLLLLLGLCGALASWEGQPRPQTPGIHLLAGTSSPKLNIISAEAPPVAAARPEPNRVDAGSQEAKHAPVILPRVSPEDAPSLEPAPLLAALPSTPLTSVLENGYADRNSQPGDSPMIRNWKMLAFETVLAGTLIPAGAQAQTTDTQLKPADMAAVLKDVQELKKIVNAIDGRVASSFRAMQEETEKRLKKLEDDGVAAALKYEKTQTDLEEIKKQLAQLRLDLDALKSRAPVNRESAYAPSPSNSPSPATGRIRLMNTFLDPMTIVVNGRAYQVGPGDTRLVEAVPAGTFNYEVLGVQSRVDRALAANETFTITVHPR
jgi:hypothetical protein